MPARVQIKQGIPYLRCPDGVKPQEVTPCEPGAKASDKEDGQAITKQVLVCPPDGCFKTGCVGHRLYEKEVTACGIDTTTAPIGATYRLIFGVYDSGGWSMSDVLEQQSEQPSKRPTPNPSSAHRWPVHLHGTCDCRGLTL